MIGIMIMIVPGDSVFITIYIYVYFFRNALFEILMDSICIFLIYSNSKLVFLLSDILHILL